MHQSHLTEKCQWKMCTLYKIFHINGPYILPCFLNDLWQADIWGKFMTSLDSWNRFKSTLISTGIDPEIVAEHLFRMTPICGCDMRKYFFLRSLRSKFFVKCVIEELKFMHFWCFLYNLFRIIHSLNGCSGLIFWATPA